MARRFGEHQFQAGAVTLNYVEGPAVGPPLVFLHGLAARWQTFMPLFPALSQEWQVRAVDLRGHGGSGWVPGHYHVDEFADDIVAFLTERVAAPAVLWGHSLGGSVGLIVAARRPELVRALIVGDTILFPSDIGAEAAISYLADMPIALRSLAKSLTQLDPSVMEAFRSGAMVADHDHEGTLRGVCCPVLLLRGDPACGALMLESDVMRALPLLKRGSAVAFPGLGHGLHVENAEPVLAAALPFLHEVRAGGDTR